VPKSNTTCAIALYTAAVMEADPRIRSVAVGPCTLILSLVRPEDGRSGGKLVVQLPKPVRGFVDGFDAGRYPRVLRLQASSGALTPAGPDGRSDDAGPVAAATS
jgi:hypothetical protein